MSAATGDTPIVIPPGDPVATLAAAHAFRDRGWRPFPLDHPGLPECASAHNRRPCDGKRGKHPVGGWATMTATRQADGMLERWFAQPRNIGIGCAGSGLLVVDDDSDQFEAWCAEQGYELPPTYRVRTSRGWHYYFSDPEREFGNTTGGLPEHIDIRGARGGAKDAGGYVVAAGSRHASGCEYLAEDPWADVAPVPEFLKMVLRQPRPGTESGSTSAAQDGWTDEPRYGRREDLIAQYTRHLRGVRTRGGNFRHELFLAARDGWRCVNAGIQEQAMVERALAEAIRRVWKAEPDERDGDIVYEEAWEAAQRSPWIVLDPPGAASSDGGDAAEDDELAAEESRWTVVDPTAYLDGTFRPEPAELMARTDGACLLYPGKVHSFYGESESGKSWLALIVCVERLAAGEAVLFLDYESDAATVFERLLMLGAEREDVRERFRYVAPEGPIDDGFRALLDRDYGLCVVDGMTDAVQMEGYGSADMDEISRWHRRYARVIAKRTGAAVVIVDHVTKADGGRFAAGSQHKLSALTGAGYLVAPDTPFGRGMVGTIVMWVTKDRPGFVRPVSGKAGRDRMAEAARIRIDSTVPGRVLAEIMPNGDADPEMAEAVANFGRDIIPRWAVPVPLTEIPEAVRGVSNKALPALVGFLRHHAGQDGDGVTLTDARTALGALPAKYDRATVLRAWGKLRSTELLRPAEANTTGHPGGWHWWYEPSETAASVQS